MAAAALAAVLAHAVLLAQGESYQFVMAVSDADGRPVRDLTRPVAAKDYWSRGFVRRWLAEEVFDAILIDRTDIKVHQSPVDLMLREAGTTHSLIVFPEGSRSVTGEIGEFYEPIALGHEIDRRVQRRPVQRSLLLVGGQDRADLAPQVVDVGAGGEVRTLVPGRGHRHGRHRETTSSLNG